MAVNKSSLNPLLPLSAKCQPAGMPRLFLALLILFTARASADKLEPRVLFLGDSITYGGNWTVYVESAIRAQKGMGRATIVKSSTSSTA